MLSKEEIELEQEILGAIFNKQMLLSKAKNVIKPKMFLLDKHRNIYNCILKFVEEGLSLDYINFVERFKEITKDMGGPAYISEIASCCPWDHGFSTKLKLLIDRYKKHEILKMVRKFDDTLTTENMIEAMEKTLEAVYKSEFKDEIDVADNGAKYIQWLYNTEEDEGIKSGFPKLDRTLGNFRKGRLITVFARSGVGKTTFSLQIALNMALKGSKVLYASGEMDFKEVFSKMAASTLNINYEDINNKNLDEEKRIKVVEVVDTLVNNYFYVTNETDFSSLISEIKLFKLKYGIDAVFVDYVNKYTSGVRGEKLTERIGVISSKLKAMALEENIVVVLVAQANRVVDRYTTSDIVEKINTDDIQDSARIEQDSDQIIALYRNIKFQDKAYRERMFKEGKLDYNSKMADKNPECINVIVKKNRHGNIDTFAMKWKGKFSKITEM